MPSTSANYVFRIQNTGAENIQLEDWGRTSKLDANKIRTIKDVLKKGSAKVATSVPSPFARMHLFDTAFQMVAEDLDGSGMYHQLVSDCLDMMQLLFATCNSAQSDFKFRNWNRVERMAALRAKGPGHPHKLLADSLELFFTGRFADVQQITLIYYKGTLVGGTSPLTLFFTGPNWQREMRQMGITLDSATNHDTYFDEDYRPLHQRDDLFVQFLVKFYLAHRTRLNQNSAGLAAYIRNTLERHRRDLAQKTADEWGIYNDNPQRLDEEYQRITVVPNSSTFLEVGGMYAYSVKTGDIPGRIEKDSDFLIIPTVEHFRQEVDAAGIPTNPAKPLVLVRGMNVSGIYTYGNTPWSPNIDVRRSSFMDTFGKPLPLGQRILPGTQTPYPFITTEDFLEDNLVKLPYYLHRDRFFTGARGDFPFLLPVKKEYFNFFTKEDLKNNLTMALSEGRLNVQLKVPVRTSRGASQILFTKDYDLTTTPTAACGADLAIFPFYRIMDAEIQALNEYTVLLADDTQGTQIQHLQFWKAEQVVTRSSIYAPTPAPRTRKDGHMAASLYYKVPAAFDFLELYLVNEQLQSFTGLVIPQWEEVFDRQATKQFTFAIDFGTSNTHVAYTPQVGDRKPVPLSVGPTDMQMVMLHQPGMGKNAAQSFGMPPADFPEILTFVNREFVPPVIGKEHGSGVSFPTRTATAEKATFQSETPEVFTNINVGFNIDAEELTPENTLYATNLKWRLENSRDQSDPERIESFFEEMLMLIRNKVILNGGILRNTKVVWLVPLSMKERSRDLFRDKWTIAFNRVFKNTGAQLLEPITESVAPYFFLKSNTDANVKDFADALNIDIGGGTSDVMFFMRKSQRYLSTSFRFAGNDIWGDGHRRNEKDNGFLRNFYAFQAENKKQPTREDTVLQNFRNDNNLTSEDVVSLLFRYDDHFRFRESILRYKPQLKLVLFLHYSAIIYHLAQVIEQEGLSVPRYFTFTGKGSQYISLMCASDVLTKFTRTLLNAYTSLEVPADFRVVLTPEPKEATANGAVLFVNSDDRDRINRDTISEVSHWGSLPPLLRSNHSMIPSEGGGAGPGRYERGLTKVGDVIRDDAFHAGVLGNVQRFIETTLHNNDVRRLLAQYEITNVEEAERFLINGDATRSGELYDSYHTLLQTLSITEEEGISETFFFLALKDSLYALGKWIAERA